MEEWMTKAGMGGRMAAQIIIDDDFDPDVAITPQIYRILRDRIVKNDLPPGAQLSETDVAGQYGVSRQPVREAFIKLAEQGLVIVRPQRKTRVTKIDFPTVMQSRFVREAVEADIVARLAATPDAALIRELRGQLKTQAHVARASRLNFINEDLRFHQTLAEAAGQDIAWRFLESVGGQMNRVRFLSLGQFPAEQLVAEHGRVVDEVESGRPEQATAAMRAHLRRINQDIPEIVSRNRECFDRYDETLIEK